MLLEQSIVEQALALGPPFYTPHYTIVRAHRLTLPPARVHQHLKIGDGDVNWHEFFSALAEIGFYDRPDTVMVLSVFAEDENAHEVSRYQLTTMTDYVAKYTK